MDSRIMYIELKSEQHDRGPARIGRVAFSRTGRTVYYSGRRLERSRSFNANYFDVATGEEYWISGCKRNGQDRHWAGGGPVEIDEDVREEYWTRIRRQPESRHKGLA